MWLEWTKIWYVCCRHLDLKHFVCKMKVFTHRQDIEECTVHFKNYNEKPNN